GGPTAVGLIRDATEREKTERMRRQFVADVSHELRTPVAAIRAASETAVGEPDLPPELERLIEIVDRQARHMEELVSDLTDLSQIEIGAVTLTIERRSAATLLLDVARDLQRPAGSRRVAVKIDAPNDVTIDGDPRRLAQILR